MYNHMKKADNFNPGQWLVENKLTSSSKLLKENQNPEEHKLKQWVEEDGGGYGPNEDDANYPEFKEKMNNLLTNTIEDLNPGNYGDSTSMSYDDILEDFIEEAISIIFDYTKEEYGDSTSFSPDDIKDDFYEFMKTP